MQNYLHLVKLSSQCTKSPPCKIYPPCKIILPVQNNHQAVQHYLPPQLGLCFPAYFTHPPIINAQGIESRKESKKKATEALVCLSKICTDPKSRPQTMVIIFHHNSRYKPHKDNLRTQHCFVICIIHIICSLLLPLWLGWVEACDLHIGVGDKSFFIDTDNFVNNLKKILIYRLSIIFLSRYVGHPYLNIVQLNMCWQPNVCLKIGWQPNVQLKIGWRAKFAAKNRLAAKCAAEYRLITKCAAKYRLDGQMNS